LGAHPTARRDIQIIFPRERPHRRMLDALSLVARRTIMNTILIGRQKRGGF